MRKSIRGWALTVGASILTGAAAWGQQIPSPEKQKPVSVDLGVTYAPERAQLVPGSCCFWMQGGGADAAMTFWNGFGIAAGISGEHASNYEPGMDVNKIAYLAGPRFTHTVRTGNSSTASRPRLQLFGQALFGGVHAFDGVFPSGSGTKPTANSFALQAGGGLDLSLTRHIGVRLFQAEYERTTLPNHAANIQDDLRLAFGITYHIVRSLPRL